MVMGLYWNASSNAVDLQRQESRLWGLVELGQLIIFCQTQSTNESVGSPSSPLNIVIASANSPPKRGCFGSMQAIPIESSNDTVR